MLTIQQLSRLAVPALLILTSELAAAPQDRTIHRTLHVDSSASIVKLRNIYSRTRHLALRGAPDARVARASLTAYRGQPAVRIQPVGAPGKSRYGHTRVHVTGQKWNFNRRRWQRFHLQIKVQVVTKKKIPRSQPVRELKRRAHVTLGRTRREAVGKTLGAPVRKLMLVSGDARVADAELSGSVLRVRGKRPGRATVMVGGQYLDRRAGRWQRFRMRLSVEVRRP